MRRIPVFAIPVEKVMKISRYLLMIPILFCTESCGQHDDAVREFFGINWTGTAALRNGDGSTALQEILIESAIDDTLYREFKLAVTYYRLRNYSTALSMMRNVVQRNSALAPIVYVYIAEIERELGRTGNTLAAYRSVLRGEISPRFRHYIYEKLRGIVEQDTAIGMEQAPWLEDYYRWLAPEQEIAIRSVIDTVDVFIREGRWRAVDSIIMNRPFSGKDACRFVKTIRASMDEKELSTSSLFMCARMARSCGELTLAGQFLDFVERRESFLDSIPQHRYLYFLAELKYNQNEWRDAIKLYKKYMGKFGQDPEALLSIARAYRKMDREDQSAVWYEKLMRAYPRHPKTQEILWLRAWQLEEDGQYDRAIQYYERIYTRFRKGSRLDESYIRHGLCRYNQKRYDSALTILEKFVNKLPQSPLLLAGYYWQAKCCLAMNRKNEAITILRLISRKDPFEYYAHRSRQLLLEMGDTSDVLIAAGYHGMQVLGWFDSISQAAPERKELAVGDSIAFLCGLYLASIGDIEKAEFFLEPLELGFPGNLALQYKLARLYIQVDATAQAFRIARRLTWRIPMEFRSELPLEIYRLFYPAFYAGAISREAKRYGIDPFLISGVIRQESIFNPQIVSPAGAVGLMQIMPYTGKYIAEKNDAAFSVDSLYVPEFNIRFGAYYLHELLQRFGGNMVLALAGYNAGPHNAQRWAKENRDKEIDLFVEDIGFTETRGYVKKVLANYWTYRFLSSYEPPHEKKMAKQEG